MPILKTAILTLILFARLTAADTAYADNGETIREYTVHAVCSPASTLCGSGNSELSKASTVQTITLNQSSRLFLNYNPTFYNPRDNTGPYGRNCLSVRVYVLVNDQFVRVSQWLAWSHPSGTLAQGGELETGFMNLGIFPAGNHVIDLRAQSRVSGCYDGSNNWTWTGEVTVQAQENGEISTDPDPTDPTDPPVPTSTPPTGTGYLLPPPDDPPPLPPGPPPIPPDPWWYPFVDPVLPSLPGISTLMSALALASSALSIMSIVAAPSGLQSLVQAFFPFIAVRRHKPPWGRVVEEKTNYPIKDAVVIIYDQAGRPRQTMKTKEDGTFATLLEKGSYRLTVTRDGYDLAFDPQGIILFPEERLYTGQPIIVEDPEVIVPIVAGMRPKEGTKSKRHSTLKGTWKNRLLLLQARVALPILFIGAALNTLVMLLSPVWYIIAVEILYLILFIIELLLSRTVRRAIGQVREFMSTRPVPLALVRLVEKETHRIVDTKVTLPHGHFLMLPPPGNYQLQVIRTGYEAYKDERVSLSKWSIGPSDLNIWLRRK